MPEQTMPVEEEGQHSGEAQPQGEGEAELHEEPAAPGSAPREEPTPAAAEKPRDVVEQVQEAALGETDLRLQLKQLSADFENFRRRSEAQQQEAQKRGQDSFLREIVPVLVDLQAALNQPASPEAQGLREGLVMVLDKLFSRIESLGYSRIASRGLRMDPRRHDALFTVPAPGHEPGTVLDELSPGFERDGKVIFPARVSVVREE